MSKKAALVLIDFINEIAHEDGKFTDICLDYVRKYHVLDRAQEALEKARKANIPVIWITLGFDHLYGDIPNYSNIFSEVPFRGALKRGEWGTMITDPLEPISNELILTKNTISPFHSTKLISELVGVDHLFVCGLTTDMSVLSTSRDCHDFGISCTVLSDACGAHNLLRHEEAINCISVCSNVSSVQNFFP